MKIGLDYTVTINDKAIINDIKTFYETFAQAATQEAANRIEKFAQQEMNGYYNEYEPDYYDRTWQMLSSSYKKYSGRFASVYEGGVIINPGFTNHSPRGITEEEIYENVWDKGIHGGEYRGRNYVNIQGEPNRFGKIESIVGSDKFKKEMFDIGMEAAMGQKYSVLRFG